MSKKLFFLITTMCFSILNYAQSPACNGAVDLNITNAFNGPAQPEDTVIDYGCVNAATQHVWYGYFTACSMGAVTITTGSSSSANDVDIVVWGPFLTNGILCSQLTSGTIAACSATNAPTEQVTFNVVQGLVYMVAAVADTNYLMPQYSTAGSVAVINTPCSTWTNCAPNAGYESLCLVTVDSATQEYKLIWTELAGNPVSHFGIQKADYLGVPQEIDTVHVTSLSEYIDFAADPMVHTERYSLYTYDTCGSGWLTNGYIEPVFCQSSLSTQGTVNVAWSHYVDTWQNGPAYYVIYRGATPAAMTAIDTVASFINYYTDINPLIGNSYYKIGVALNAPCVPMRLMQNAQTNYFVQSFSNASSVEVVGLGENSLQEVSLFPNPTDGNITVKSLFAPALMRVYDVSGRVIVQQQLLPGASQQISLENLDAGMYSLIIENDNGFFRENVVLRR